VTLSGARWKTTKPIGAQRPTTATMNCFPVISKIFNENTFISLLNRLSFNHKRDLRTSVEYKLMYKNLGNGSSIYNASKDHAHNNLAHEQPRFGSISQSKRVFHWKEIFVVTQDFITRQHMSDGYICMSITNITKRQRAHGLENEQN
jgi:hypothetical protein